MPEGVLQHTNKHGGMSQNGRRKCPGKHINTSNTTGTTSPREFTISVSDRTPFPSMRSCLCEAGFLTVVGIKRKYCVKINEGCGRWEQQGNVPVSTLELSEDRKNSP